MNHMKRTEIKIPFSFMTMSILWIIFSVNFFLYFQRALSPSQLTHIQTIKGCFFVVAITFFMYMTLKAATKKMLQREEEYKDLFYNIPTPMMLLNLKTQKFSLVNKAALVTYGYSAEDFAA